MEYKMTPVEWNGVSITGGNFECSFPIAADGPGVTRRREPVAAEIVGIGSRFVRSQPQPAWWTMSVKMRHTDEADVNEMLSIFNEDNGLGILKAMDGDGELWQVTAAIAGTERAQGTRHIRSIVFYVPDAVWEEAAPTTDIAGGSFEGQFSLTVLGNRSTRPTFTIVPQQASAVTAFRGFVANRSPKAWANLPVYLGDEAGAPGTFPGDVSGARVWINDGEVRAYVDDMGDVVVNLTLPAARSTVLDDLIHLPFVVALDDLSPGPDFSNDTNERPAFVLPESSNLEWRYGINDNDPLAVFYDPTAPARTAMWRPSNELPAADLNAAIPLRLDTSIDKLQWSTDDEEISKPLEHRMVASFPQGITSIKYERQVRYDKRLRVLGRGISGDEVEVADWRNISETLDGAETELVLTDPAFSLVINAVRAAICGNDLNGGDSTENLDIFSLTGGIDGGPIYDTLWQKIELDNPTDIECLHMQFSGSGIGEVMLLNNQGGDQHPEDGRVVAWFNYWSTTDPVQDGSLNVQPSGGYAVYEGIMWDGSKKITLRLAAGVYWLRVRLVGAGSLNVRSTTIVNTKHNLLKAGVDDSSPNPSPFDITIQFSPIAKSLWFRLVHPHGGPVQPESSLVREIAEGSKGGPVELDRIVAISATDLSPYVTQSSESLAHVVGILTNLTTGQSMIIDKWMAVGAELTIDCERQAVIYTEDSVSTGSNGAVHPQDENWIELVPGENIIEFVSALNVELSTSYRARKV